MAEPVTKRSILVTGAAGYLGRELIAALLKPEHAAFEITGLDIATGTDLPKAPRFEYVRMDIRSPELPGLLAGRTIDTVVHLASIVNPGAGAKRQLAFDVDVRGTEHLVRCAVETGVRQFILTSSGAAYGYHADNAIPLHEDDALRGNTEFAYAHHKRLVEEMLAGFRARHPELRQLIFRPGTILGEHVHNQITALFEKKTIPGVRGAETPFVFIWDRDVVRAIIQGIVEDREGIFNLAGDGSLTLAEIAERMGHTLRRYPAWLLKLVLGLLHFLRLTPYGPEQVRFLRYRPVLANDRLKSQFGYVPELTSEQTFELYRTSRIQNPKGSGA